jgi:hypothetical protein
VRPGRVVDELDARRLGGDDEHAVGRHHEQDVGVAAGAREPLLAVDDPLVAVAEGVRLEQVRVGPALRLGHRVGRPELLVHERDEPPLLLLGRAVGGEHLHVAGVGRGRAEEARRRRVPAQDLVDQRQLELPEARAAQLLVEEQRPQAPVLDLLLQGAGARLHRRVAEAERRREDQVERGDLLPAELLDPIELLLEFGLGREVPGHALPLGSPWRQ